MRSLKQRTFLFKSRCFNSYSLRELINTPLQSKKQNEYVKIVLRRKRFYPQFYHLHLHFHFQPPFHLAYQTESHFQLRFLLQFSVSVGAKSIYEDEFSTNSYNRDNRKHLRKDLKENEEGKQSSSSSPTFSPVASTSPLSGYVLKDVCKNGRIKMRNTILMKSMEEIYNSFAHCVNELKNYEYVYFLFKIYEVLFLNIYNCSKDSKAFQLNNPNFELIPFPQYVRRCLKKKNFKGNENEKHHSFDEKKERKWGEVNVSDGNQREIECDRNYFNEIHSNILTKLYFQYITYLDSCNIKKEQWKKYTDIILTKTYVDLYNKTVQIIYKKIYSFSCFEIINFLYISKKINVCSIKDIYMLAQHFIFRNLPNVEEEELIKIGYVFLDNSNKKRNVTTISKKNNKDFLETYLHFILYKIKNMNNENFVKVLEYVSNNNYKHIHFYKECKKEIYRRINHFSIEQKIQLFYLYSQNVNASDKLLMSTFIEEIAQFKTPTKLENVDTERRGDQQKQICANQVYNIPLFMWLNGIWANAKYFKEHPILLKGAESLIIKNVSHFDASSVSMLIWAYSSVEIRKAAICFDPNIYVLLKKRALKLYRVMTPKQLSNTLLGLSITLGKTITSEGIVDTDFHQQVERYLLECPFPPVREDGMKKEHERSAYERKEKKKENILHYFTTEDIANTCYSYCIVRCGSKELHAILQNALINKTDDLSPQQITKLVYTYGNLYIYASYTFLSLLQYEILQRIHQFNYNEICDILWGYCINKYYDPHYWKTLLYIMDFEKVYNDERCSLLYSCLSFINLINPSILESYNVLRIFKLLREQYWQFQTAEFPYAFANEVMEIIQKENHLLEMQEATTEIKKEAEEKEEEEIGAEIEKKEKIVKASKKNPLYRFEYLQKLFDFEGLLIDIYFEYKNEKYALFLHTALNTTVDGNPLGESILKSRFFKKKKFRQVHLLHSIWKKEKNRKIDLIYAQL